MSPKINWKNKNNFANGVQPGQAEQKLKVSKIFL